MMRANALPPCNILVIKVGRRSARLLPMLPRRRTIFTLITAALLLACGAMPSQAALSPYTSASGLSSLSFIWGAAGSPYVVALSTDPLFLVQTATGALSANTTSYTGLSQDTLYYFRVKSQSAPDSAYETASTATWVAAPAGLYSVPSYFTSDSSFTATARLGWDTGGNPVWTAYEMQYALNSSFSPSATAMPGYPPATLGGLNANTTYYFKVRAVGVSGVVTPYAPYISTATMALALPGVSEKVHETSATISWTPVYDATVQALTSEGYKVLLQSDPTLTSPSVWVTASPTASSADFTGLARNTGYWYKAGALNWTGAPNMSDIRYFVTLAAVPQGLARSSVTAGAASLTWTPLGPGETYGYRLEASADPAWSYGAIQSSSAYDASVSTLTIDTLDSNTTYYFRAASLNTAGAPDYTASLSSVTLALAIPGDVAWSNAQPQAITVEFIPLPQTLQSLSCEGYRLEASTAPFGSGGAVISSATYDVYPTGFTRQLTAQGLAPNNTYYLRLGTLNWQYTPDYTVLPSTHTGFPGNLTNVTLDAVWSSSASVSFTPGIAAEGHVAEASASPYFDTIYASSYTPSGTASNLIVSGLDPNTTYYFRAGALYNGATVYTNTVPDYRQTLPQPLTALSFAGVYQSSVTVSWAPLAGTSQISSAESYILQGAVSPAFSPVLFSSSTADISRDRLTISGLSPDTSYYFRAGTVNMEGSVNYSLTPDTSTMANQPAAQSYTAITPDSLTLTWGSHGNPADTRYMVEMSSYPDYSYARPAQTVALTTAAFSGLLPNTTYYSRATAINRLGRATPALDFSPMATGAFDPGVLPFSGVGVSSLTVNWSSGAAAGFFNNPGTFYLVSISSEQAFSGTVLSSTTLGLSATFYGLLSDTSYYLHVSALNLTGVPTDPPAQLGTALTLPATAYLLPPDATFPPAQMMIDGFTAAWGPNGNSPDTRYYVEASTVNAGAGPDFSVIASSCLAQGLACTLTGLQIDTQYWLRVQAIGQTGALADFVQLGSTRTLLSATGSAPALQDTVVTLDASYGQISVHIPPGALGGATRLTLSPSTTTLAGPASAVSALTPTGIGVTINYFPPALVLGAITITVPYRLSDLPANIDPARLVLAFYDETDRVWVPLPSVSNVPARLVTAQTWHLSTFQLMQTNPTAGLSGVKVYPNPYRPNSVTGVMHFADLPPYSEVKIYTFLGELVRKLKADIDGMAQWDGLNRDGREAASGVYIAYVQSPDKKSSRSLKVAVER